MISCVRSTNYPNWQFKLEWICNSIIHSESISFSHAILLFHLLLLFSCNFQLNEPIQFPKRTIDGQFECAILWWMQFYYYYVDSTTECLARWIRNKIRNGAAIECDIKFVWLFFTKFVSIISFDEWKAYVWSYSHKHEHKPNTKMFSMFVFFLAKSIVIGNNLHGRIINWFCYSWVLIFSYCTPSFIIHSKWIIYPNYGTHQENGPKYDIKKTLKWYRMIWDDEASKMYAKLKSMNSEHDSEFVLSSYALR